MIFAKETTYGVDSKIKLIQRFLDDKLSNVWNGSINIYGRAVKILRKDNLTLQFWEVKDDYREQFIDNKIPAIVGFILREKQIGNGILRAEIDIVFRVNVKDIYSTSIYEDERAFVDAYKIVSRCGYISEITGTQKDVDNVFSGYYTDNIKYADMSPFTVFSFRCLVEFNDKTC